MENVIAIIQARMGSSRLPGKVMKDIGGKPVLQHVIERSKLTKSLSGVAVATTIDPGDDAIEAFCISQGVLVFRGSMQDVLDRYYRAARQFKADAIVRITADCPLIDSGLIDQTVTEFERRGVDFAANRLPPPFKRTFPIGLDVEVASFAALERAWREATEKYEREHVMPYLYEKEGRFKVFVLNNDVDYGSLRWTLDTPEDLELVRAVFARFAPRTDFTWQEVLRLFQREPELAAINSGVVHKTYLDVDERNK
jgi:spore coat polysaccharide biosynthesis protein SpsF